MIHVFKWVFSLTASMLLCLGAEAADRNFATLSEAQALLDRAASFVETYGKEQAARVFMDRNGPFRDRDLYVSMSNVDDGIRLSHADPHLIGRTIIHCPDAEGKPYGDAIRDIALRDGEGRYDYCAVNPLTGRPMRKTGLIRRVDGVILVVGAYSPMKKP